MSFTLGTGYGPVGVYSVRSTKLTKYDLLYIKSSPRGRSNLITHFNFSIMLESSVVTMPVSTVSPPHLT
jgi:hypothetical protein